LRKDAGKLAFSFIFAPEETSLAEMAGAAGLRWTIEEAFQRAKDDLGLDHCEARSRIWLAPPHDAGHVRRRLPRQAHRAMAQRSSQTERQASNRTQSSRMLGRLRTLVPSPSELKRIMAKLTKASVPFDFVMRWSLWR
jgi:SRSO17 transposase